MFLPHVFVVYVEKSIGIQLRLSAATYFAKNALSGAIERTANAIDAGLSLIRTMSKNVSNK